MGKQWCEYLIDAVITFAATGAGVYGAFFFDNFRDNKAKRDLRQRLLRGLSNEILLLGKFLNDNSNLVMHTDYFIETRILEDTVKDQIDYLDDEELIVLLSNLRLLVKKINKKLELWSLAHLEMRSSQNPQWQNVARILKTEWDGLRTDSLAEIRKIYMILKMETKENLVQPPG